MGRFDNSNLQKWTQQATSAAAPKGARQGARAGRGWEQAQENGGRGRFANSQLGQWTSQRSFADNAQTWYTGRNYEGNGNGWNTGFAKQGFEGMARAQEQGTLGTYFSQKDATGVATWDHKTQDGEDVEFGDIFENGKKVGNVYKQFGSSDGDLMMADWLFDARTKAEIFASDDRAPRLAKEVQSLREANNKGIAQREGAMKFEGDVEARADKFRAGAVDEGLVAGSALGTAATGAGIGAVAGGPIGAAVGGAFGFGVGLLGGLLNRDELTASAARAYEITSKANTEIGAGSGFFSGVEQWAGVGAKFISPLSNITHGAVDAAGKSEVGDGDIDFYRVDKETGERTVSKWVRIADVGATIGDGLLQFASPVGIGLYSTQMTGVIGGEVGQLVVSGGKTFDDRRGGFDNIFTNEDGDADWKSGAAGIGKVAIDAVQLGMARGLGAKANAARVQAGEKPMFGAGFGPLSVAMGKATGGASVGVVGKASEKVAEKLPRWLGGQTDSAAAKAALEEGGKRVSVGGFNYVTNAAGQAVSRRASISILAPSEQLTVLSSGMKARRAASTDGIKADDYYQAATALAMGSSRWTSTVVNAIGEGYEEGVQAMLEPWSHNADINAWQVFESAMYGAAAGAGMAGAMAWREPAQDKRMFNMARTNYGLRTGGVELTRKEWDSYSPERKRMLAAQTKLEKVLTNAAFEKIQYDMSMGLTAGAAGVTRLHDAVVSTQQRALASTTDSTDGTFTIIPHETAPRLDKRGNLLPGSVPADSIGASALQTARNLLNQSRGIDSQREYLEREVAAATADAAADPADADAAGRLAELQVQLDTVKLSLAWGRRFDAVFDQMLNRLQDENRTTATVEASAESANLLLRSVYNMAVDQFPEVDGTLLDLTPADKKALARYVSVVATRDPLDQAGSFQMLVPQISAKLTWYGADNVLEVSNAILPAIRGDFDGDKMGLKHQLILDESEFDAARAGTHFIGAGSSVNVGPPKYEKYIVAQMAEALDMGGAMASVATEAKLSIGQAIRDRYRSLDIDTELDAVLASFYSAINRGEGDARDALLSGLAGDALGGRISEFAYGNLSNEWLWIDTLVRSTIQDFQVTFASAATRIQEPNTTKVTPHAQTEEVRTRKLVRAATLGDHMNLLLPGESPFRQFQKLHFSFINSTDIATNGYKQSDLTELAFWYEAQSSGVSRAELDEIRSKDEITGRVYAMLRALAVDAVKLDPNLNAYEALAVVANLRVVDFETDKDGNVTTDGQELSLAQLLLKKEVQRDWTRNAAIYDSSPSLQAKYARLLKMTRQSTKDHSVNAERAFIEVIGSQQLYTLLGEEAANLGPHLTVEQWLRGYVSKSTSARQDIDNQLKLEASYLERDGRTNMPYSLNEVISDPNDPKGKVSAYRVMVDAMLAVGHNTLTMDPKMVKGKLTDGHLHGSAASQHYRVSRDIQQSVTTVKQAILELARLSPGSSVSVEQVQRLFEQNPDLARQVFELIPKSAAFAVLRQDENGEVRAANWFFEMFTIKDAAQAEMHYWRNLLLSEWASLGGRSMVEKEAATHEEHGRAFDRLPRRVHRIMYALAKEQDGGLLYSQFIDKLTNMTSLEGFLRWVNTTPGILGDQAPIAGWVDDVAEFDQDKAQGGWSQNLQGAELREAIATLRKGSAALVKDITNEQLAFDYDADVMSSIERAIDRGDAANDTDKTNLARFTKAIEEAGKTLVGLGPQAMIYETVGAVLGFYPQAHTKGTNPDNVELQGVFDAQRDAFDFVTNYERVMASLTAANLNAVGSNLSQVNKDGVRSMDDMGVTVSQPVPTPKQMLALLTNPDTRPMARAMLFPQVMERGADGKLHAQMLVGKSLTELLTGGHSNKLFHRDGKLSNDSALRYAAMVEAQARVHGGHFSMQRAVTDVVVARTSSADHVLSTSEIEKMTVDAYRTVALILQRAGSLASMPRNPGTDPFATARERLVKGQRALTRASTLQLDKDSVPLVDIMIKDLVKARTEVLNEELSRIRAELSLTNDAGEKLSLEKQAIAAAEDLERYKTRAGLLGTEDEVAYVVEMFNIPASDNAEAASKKSMLVKYIYHNGLFQVGAVRDIVAKVTMQLQDKSRGGQVKLKDKEWKELSNAAIAVYLDEAASTTAAGISLQPFPDGDMAANQRYYDRSYSYLMLPMLDVNSPLLMAARDLHRLSGRQNDDTDVPTLMDTISEHLYRDFNYGPWTSDIPRRSAEANQRLDSAAAAQAIAMVGNSAKRQAAISAATRRTFLRPDESLLTTVTLTRNQLNQDAYSELDVILPGATQPSKMPLLQLNNRFASEVVATFEDGSTVDLLEASPELGRVWRRETSVEESGYREIHLSRLNNALEKAARDKGMRASRATVQVKFFHPDSQPVSKLGEANWYNNIYFEGTSFSLDADRHESLISTLWFAVGSINPEAQAAALDASKLGLPALQVVETPTAEDREIDEELAFSDFAAMLRNKTERIMTTNLGTGRLDPEFYNVVYKDMKLRHFVRGRNSKGVVELWTAEQVIAHQQTSSDPLPLQDPVLWVPTDNVLRQMLSEPGSQGGTRIFADQLEVNLSNVPTYAGVSPDMMVKFQEGLESTVDKDLSQTDVVNRARMGTLMVRAFLTEAERTAYEAKLAYFKAERDDIITERAPGTSGMNLKKNWKSFNKRTKDVLSAENLQVKWNDIGVSHISTRATQEVDHSKRLLRRLAAALKPNDYRAAWIYREGGKALTVEGQLSEENIGGQPRGGGLRVAPGDVVLIELDSFDASTDPLEQARKRINFFTSKGATVVLGNAEGRTDLRAELSDYLVDSLNYEKLQGSEHVYEPRELNSRYQTQVARASTLTAMEGVSAANRIILFNVRNQSIEENAAWVNGDNPNLAAIAVSMNLVPTEFLADYNVPITPEQIERVRLHLQGELNSAEGLALMKAQSGDATDDTFDEAYQRMLDRFELHPGTVLPQRGDTFGTGDLIPLLDAQGHVLLYRHGYMAPHRSVVDSQLARNLPGRDHAASIAVFSSKREPNATVHTGTVKRFKPRAGYGLSVELELDLQLFGDKKILEWNGMKYLLTPKPDNIVLPSSPLFSNGRSVDAIASAHDALSKQSHLDEVTNHRNAFAFFGINFLPDVTEHFFPGQGQDPDRQLEARTILAAVAKARALEIPLGAAAEIMGTSRIPKDLMALLDPAMPGLAGNLNDQSVEAQITRAVLIYLSTPNARVSDILSSGGFNNLDSSDPSKQSVKMPSLFTEFFDRQGLDSPLRLELNRRFNEQFDNSAGDGSGYVLLPDWTFQSYTNDKSQTLEGYLQFAEAYSSGDNPLKNGMAFESHDKAGVSAHNAYIAYQAIGADTAHRYEIPEILPKDALDGGVWRLLTDVPEKAEAAFQAWRAQTPAEAERRSRAREAVVQFRAELELDDKARWNETEVADYTQLRYDIVNELGLLDSQARIVDFWVRQNLGMPAGHGDNVQKVTGAGAVDAAREILQNVKERYYPTSVAEVPLMHIHDLQLIFRANKNRDRAWLPRESASRDSGFATEWKDWVNISLGGALLSEELFDPLYLLAVDGLMHTYQSATKSLIDLPVSMDPRISYLLMDEKTNQMLASIDPGANLLATDPVAVDVTRATLDQLIGGQRIAGRLKGVAAPASERARRREARRKWRRENGVPAPMDISMKNFRKNGAEFTSAASSTNALARSLINLRVGTALINPALYVSMGPEQWIRGSLDRAANILSGTSTAGLGAAGLARAGLSHYTPEEITGLNRLYRELGRRADFKAMVYQDLWYRRPFQDGGTRRGERALEAYAKFGSRLQDPTYGMKANTMARRYLEAALQHIDALPTEHPITAMQLVAEMTTNPLFLEDRFPDAHKAGVNSIAQIRSLKATPLSLALRGIYEPLSESENSAFNFLGNVLLKLPLLFSGYAMNVLTTITGLQGVSDMSAMFMEGRAKGPYSFIGRIQAKMRGAEFSETDDANFDMSSVLEGIDLSRSFIRGGLTHTGLFAFGLMAGGLGLSGEDEETKRRRRAAEYQGAGFVYDPRNIVNDFRNADDIYVDQLPFGLGRLFGGPDQMGQPHWILKQFISPMVGMEKFFETGDFRHVTWGFQDALGAFPLINTMAWNDAVETGAALAEMADVAARGGEPEDLLAAGNFLTTALGTYERMLFENAFVNMLYVSADKYDRDPYSQPAYNEDGTPRTDALGQPQESRTLQPFVGDDKMVREGYVSRGGADAALHALTENRATMASVLNLFTGITGGDADYWRRQMPIKTRTIEKTPISQDQAEALITGLAQGNAARGEGTLGILNAEELASIWINQAKAQGGYTDWGMLRTEAEKWVAQGRAGTTAAASLSVLDKDGREVLTTLGARAVMRGISKGSVAAGDASLAGVHIPFEMREEIQKDWMAELMQEGLNMGLDQFNSERRMKRLWYGPTADPSIKGLGDILWDKNISYSPKVTYNQLNTTYVIGPDGMPWATGHERGGFLNAIGLKPLTKMIRTEGDGTTNDDRLNTVDRVNGMNTGLRALEIAPDAYIPTDEEIGKAIEKAIEEAAKNNYTPFADAKKTGSGSAWRNFGGYGGRRYGGYGGGGWGGGGGGGGGGFARFEKMFALPESRSPYGDSIPFINTSNPLLRREGIRRERVWSERGKLKQWQ